MKRRSFLLSLLTPLLPTPQLPMEVSIRDIPGPSRRIYPSIRECLEAHSMKEPVEGFSVVIETKYGLVGFPPSKPIPHHLIDDLFEGTSNP